MIIEDVISFLKKIPPFQFLDDTTLNDVVNNLSMEFYPKGTVILKQDGPPSDALRVIKKGGVKVSVRSENNEDVIVDFRSEGDNFGMISLMSKDKQKTTIVAVEDTICYLLNKEAVYRLIDTNPAFTEHVLQFHFSKYIDKTYREMHNKSLFYGSSDHLLFTTQVGDIATTEVLTIPAATTIQEAAQAMSRQRISSIVVVDDAGAPCGIVTDRDLREKVVARGRDVSSPVSDIMSFPLVQVDAKDFCFEAVIRMIKNNIHHILVIRDGRLRGVLTNHDLMLLQGTSPLSLTKDIESQQSLEGLVPASRKVNNIIGLLIKEGARAGNITRILTELNDRLVRKVLDFTEKKLGPPPVPYSWVSFGSEGRKEQTFKTDQDNAIIYQDPGTDSREEEARQYFSSFADAAREGLIQVGFPLCPANYMASNPQWCQPLRVWKRYVSDWISTPTPEALMNALVFFDFRPVHGEASLAEELREYLIASLRDKKVFLGYLANMAIKNAPPVGFLKSFVVEKDGEHKDELNLKVKGIAPIVDIVRLFALERGVPETSTLERIAALRESHTIVQEYADEFAHAFEFIMLLRIHHQYEQMSAGQTVNNFINPNALSNLEKRSIKDAFQLITKIQDMIIERYKSLIW
jgi:CBS domain-containing protein